MIIVTFFYACSSNKNEQLSSPDGKIVVTFSLTDGIPLYSVQKNGKEILKPSQLGFLLDSGDSFYAGFKLTGVSKTSFDETWQQIWGEGIDVRDHYNELKINLQEEKGKQRLLNLVFRVFDDGVGFRYEFPEQENLKAFEITDELTEFALVSNDSAWSIPAYKGEYYEVLWKKNSISKLDTVTTPVTIETSDGKYILLHEAAAVDYAERILYPAIRNHAESGFNSVVNRSKSLYKSTVCNTMAYYCFGRRSEPAGQCTDYAEPESTF